MSQTNSKLIAIRIPTPLYNLIKKKAQEEHRPLSNYVKKRLIDDLDATEYLLSTEANKKSMYKMLEEAKNNEKPLTFKNVDEVISYVQNIAK